MTRRLVLHLVPWLVARPVLILEDVDDLVNISIVRESKFLFTNLEPIHIFDTKKNLYIYKKFQKFWKPEVNVSSGVGTWPVLISIIPRLNFFFHKLETCTYIQKFKKFGNNVSSGLGDMTGTDWLGRLKEDWFKNLGVCSHMPQ